MNKRFTTAIAAAFAVLALAGCASSDTNDFTVDEGVDTSDIPQADREEIFLMVIRDEYPADSAGIPDSTFLELADTTCGALDAGVPYYTVLEKVAESDLDARFGGFLIGASVSAFCPEYEDQL